MSTNALSLVSARRRSALSRALGPQIAAALEADDVVEAMVNADGVVWLDRVGAGLIATVHSLSAPDREAAIRLLAHEAGELVGEDRPFLATILPDSAARVQALLPPLVEAPVLTIRKRAKVVFSLSDYVRDGIATGSASGAFVNGGSRAPKHCRRRRDGSGKTTLLNALLAEDAFHRARRHLGGHCRTSMRQSELRAAHQAHGAARRHARSGAIHAASAA